MPCFRRKMGDLKVGQVCNLPRKIPSHCRLSSSPRSKIAQESRSVEPVHAKDRRINNCRILM
jgi:hypothetical protein